MTDTKPKALVWIASSRRDMRAMPREVRRSFGVAGERLKRAAEIHAVKTKESRP